MSATSVLVLFHAAVSLVAIVSGLVAIMGHIRGAVRPRGTALFLVTAIATSATGLGLPPGAIGGTFEAAWIGLAVLGIMLVALFGFGARGVWRPVYTVGLLFSMLLLVFAGVAQAFLKIPVLHALAPQLNEAPFIAAEVAAVALFLALGILALRAPRTGA
jgi:hypothetical protein